MLLEHAFVVVCQVEGPWADDARHRPRRVSRTLRARTGRNVGEHTRRRLRVIDIHQPLGKERRHVGVLRGGADKHLRVAHPTHAFIALGAIGGNRQEVAALAPLNVGLQLIDPRIGAGKLPVPCRIRPQHDARNGVQRRLPRQPGHLHITKPMERKRRLPYFRAASFARVTIDGRCPAKIGQIDGAVGLEHLGMPQGDDRSRRGIDLEPDDADHVLPQVERPAAGDGSESAWA